MSFRVLFTARKLLKYCARALKCRRFLYIIVIYAGTREGIYMAEKYRLIIVDDEYLVRKGIIKTVDWASLGVEVIAECDNGRQALEAVRKYSPDLIISDVRMPVMDGLELAEKLNEDDFDGAIIFYSGYSDFEYVRKALEYGVSGYVLKPEENEQLTKKVVETIAALEERRKNRTALASLVSGVSYVREMYFSRLEEGVDDKSLRDQLSVADIVIPPSGTVVYGRALRVQDAAFGRLYEQLMRALENFSAVGCYGDERFIIITKLADADALCECAERLLDECGRDAAVAAVGISSAFGRDISLASAVVQAGKAAHPVLEVGGVYLGDEGAYRGNKKTKGIVEAALAIIYESYAEKLTVKSVADKLFVSESHLMHEIKVVTGKTFNDCLKHYRIAKAKELLKQGEMRVNEIAAAVGFSDGRYFGQVFKDVVGITPSEYLEKLNEEN